MREVLRLDLRAGQLEPDAHAATVRQGSEIAHGMQQLPHGGFAGRVRKPANAAGGADLWWLSRLVCLHGATGAAFEPQRRQVREVEHVTIVNCHQRSLYGRRLQ